MTYAIQPAPPVALSIDGSDAVYPVLRVWADTATGWAAPRAIERA
jgi:hypothetical protein